jgi:putative ABC transport system permease protein
MALALGIGFSSIVFSIFYNGVLNPFPCRDADRLASIRLTNDQLATGFSRGAFHLDEIIAFQRESHTLEDIVAVSSWDVLFFHQGVNEPIHGCVVTPNAMSLYGVPPLLGRGLTERDALPGSDPVVVLGYWYWKSEFNQDKSVIGSTLMIDNQPRTVIGVMPPRFYLFGADFYAPIAWNHPELPMAQATYFFPTAMIKKGVSAKAVNGKPMTSVSAWRSASARNLSRFSPWFCVKV